MVFLSRLCGGEPFEFSKTHSGSFLSRLCGGELWYSDPVTGIRFLSRLCGGELIVFKVKTTVFVSKPPVRR